MTRHAARALLFLVAMPSVAMAQEWPASWGGAGHVFTSAGGDCTAPVGTFNSGTDTCTLLQNLGGPIEVQDGTTLDCDGHFIWTDPEDIALYVPDESANVVIRGCTVYGGLYGLAFGAFDISDVTIEENIFTEISGSPPPGAAVTGFDEAIVLAWYDEFDTSAGAITFRDNAFASASLPSPTVGSTDVHAALIALGNAPDYLGAAIFLWSNSPDLSVVFEGNRVEADFAGWLGAPDGASAEGNRIEVVDGLIVVSAVATVQGNDVRGDDTGIIGLEVHSDSLDAFEGNLVSGFDVGVGLSPSTYGGPASHTVKSNQVTGNVLGLYARDDVDGKIFGNDFFANGDPQIDPGALVLYDDTGSADYGNFWGHTCADWEGESYDPGFEFFVTSVDAASGNDPYATAWSVATIPLIGANDGLFEIPDARDELCPGYIEDSDLDEVLDAFDSCPSDANILQLNDDADGDTLGAACDPCPFDPLDDADSDGHCADVDNCPGAANASQADDDNDGAGNACDTDDDEDGVADGSDDCPTGDNGWLSTGATDHDEDGCRDGGEDTDDDSDGMADGPDDCPAGDLGWTSGSGTDADEDGCRDAGEDTDDDNDGTTDASDTCPGIVDVGNDEDEDELDDACDPDGDGDGWIDNLTFVFGLAPVTDASNSDVDGDGTSDYDELAPLDLNSDGVITRAEVLVSAMAPDDDADGIANVFESADLDSDGDLAVDENDARPDGLPLTPLWLLRFTASWSYSNTNQGDPFEWTYSGTASFDGTFLAVHTSRLDLASLLLLPGRDAAVWGPPWNDAPAATWILLPLPDADSEYPAVSVPEPECDLLGSDTGPCSTGTYVETWTCGYNYSTEDFELPFWAASINQSGGSDRLWLATTTPFEETFWQQQAITPNGGSSGCPEPFYDESPYWDPVWFAGLSPLMSDAEPAYEVAEDVFLSPVFSFSTALLLGSEGETFSTSFDFESPDETFLLTGSLTLSLAPVLIDTPNGDPAGLGAPDVNEFTFDTCAAGVLCIPFATQSLQVDSVTVFDQETIDWLDDQLRWDVTEISDSHGAGTETALQWIDPTVSGVIGEGLAPTAEFTGLPSDNDQFGTKYVFLGIDDGVGGVAGLSGRGVVRPYEVFFARDAANHPGGQSGAPNWYHYWSQTPASVGSHAWQSGAGPSNTTFVSGGLWVANIRNAQTSTSGGTWNDAQGIDLFANVIRHEGQHLQDLIGFWGATQDRVPSLDLDADFIPDTLEASLVSGHAYDPGDQTTFADGFSYLPPPPGGPLIDIEDYALRRQAAWTSGAANSLDWSAPGMQHDTLGEPND